MNECVSALWHKHSPGSRGCELHPSTSGESDTEHLWSVWGRHRQLPPVQSQGLGAPSSFHHKLATLWPTGKTPWLDIFILLSQLNLNYIFLIDHKFVVLHEKYTLILSYCLWYLMTKTFITLLLHMMI